MKILIAGDTHGDKDNILHLTSKASGNGCEKILILGDFGYFPHMANGQSFLDYCEKMAKTHKIEIHWIKGNHDNHEALAAYSGAVKIRPHVIFHQNLHVWKWGKYNFCAVGGAYSIDKNHRTIGIDWWIDEQVSMADVYNCEDIKENVDIIVSHDCPMSVNINSHLDFKNDPETANNRNKLQAIVDVLKPSKVFHGHYHVMIEDGIGNHPDGTFDSIGLASNVNPRKKQTLIFDCEV